MRALGIILAGGNNENLGELTSKRATSAMPIAAGYRAIDFSLSNMTSSGVRKVAVITQYNSRSLHDHLSSSKWWDFGRKQGGLFIMTPFISKESSSWFRGTADAMSQNMIYLKKSNEKYVIVANGNCIYKTDYNKMLDFHIEKGADITLMCKEDPTADKRKYGVMDLDQDGKVIDFEEKPLESEYNHLSLGIYIMERTLLIKLLETAANEDRYDFSRDIVMRYRKKLNIYGYKFDGYWSSINDVASYYQANMDFLNKDIRDTFFKTYPYIDTKPKDEPPAKYNIGAVVKESLVGSGVILNGYVEKSVLFRRVYTGENTVIKNSIIMNSSYIGNNCIIENAIIDKEVIVSDGKNIIGDKDRPVIITKGTVL